ncbi:hypothetical protein KXV85_005172, partial [Aspergillus fumigatus]
INVVAIVAGTWNRPGWSAPGEANEIKQFFATARWPATARMLASAVDDWKRWALFTLPGDGEWHEGQIALLGDGSAMYAIQGLWSAAKLGTPVSFIIFNNSRYEALRGFGRLFGMQTVEGTDLAGLDFVQIAAGQGVMGRRVEKAADLDAALNWSLGATGPTLVE